MSDHRVLLVTGASGSIGGEIAAEAGRRGWQVAVHGRSEASAAAAADRLREAAPGARYEPFACDFPKRGEIEQLVAAVDAKFGRIDGVVNCAVSAPPGISGPFLQTDPDAYAELCLHAIATLQWLCRAVFPIMARGGGGSLIAVASDAGLFPAPNQSMIGPTRAAIMSFCKNVALEVSTQNIRVNCLTTSFVEETRIMKMIEDMGGKRPESARKRAGLGPPAPPDLAALAMYLLEPGSAKLTGQVISMNGGLNT
jgi:3-oxoacyl-[acyl-carrier protein] reductase